MLIERMNPSDLTIDQLRRAAAIKERIEGLNKELHRLLGVSSNAASPKRRTMSASVKRKIAAAQKARWAKMRQAKPATRSARRTARTGKKTFSPATRAKLSARLKAYWAAKKAGRK
jgi:hypothetical protein